MRLAEKILIIIAALLFVGCSHTQSQGPALDVIFDTDANNELDDQHAIAYLLLNEETFNVLGITTNATHNGGDIAMHCLEAERVMSLVGKSNSGIPVVPGANGTFDSIKGSIGMEEFDGSEAVDFIIENAKKKSQKDKLTLIAVGKLTNVALAFLIEPSIIPNVKLIWLGSNYPDSGEYNLEDDIPSMNYILDTNVEMEIVTVCYNKPSGTDAVRITKAKAQEQFAGKGPYVSSPITGRHGGEFHCFGDYSVSLFEHIEYYDEIKSRALFDMAAVAVTKNSEWAEKEVIPAPTMVDGKWIDRPGNKRQITLLKNFDSESIISDFIDTLNSHE